jgi:hypothetical protein
MENLMKQRKPFTILLAAFILIVGIVSETSADISNAAVLFLRIAPGARPAGMGEAFVAIADDATATHWNPAGLGSYPLSDSWKEAKIPEHLKPITAMTVLRKEGGKGYAAYDIWAISSKGVVRYDNKEWHLGEVFSTRTDETVAGKVKGYFNISDEAELAKITKRVAAANNNRKYEFVQWLKDTVMANVPEDYNLRESMAKGFDSLLTGYDQCLINWSRVGEAHQQFSDGMQDGKLSQQELDRINFAVERSRNRFIPEELLIPYSAVLEGEPFDIAASLELLLVATTENLFAYDGRRWRPLHSADDSLAYSKVNTLAALDKHILVGTDNGLLAFSGAKLRQIEKSEQLPSGDVTAIGANDISDMWIVINNDLYHYNGTSWTNNRQYTAVLDDTPESIATKFSIYGTPLEKSKYISKLQEVNKNAPQTNPSDLVSPTGERKTLTELMEEMKQPVPGDSAITQDSGLADSGGAIGVSESVPSTETPVAVETEGSSVDPAPAEPKLSINPGDVIRVPFLSEIRGKVNTIHVHFDDIWLGTEYGIVHFDGKKWEMPGYRDTVITQATSLSQLAATKVLSDTARMESYAKCVSDINEISSGTIESNTKIKIPSNPAAASVNEIGQREEKVFFATAEGLIEYDGAKWRRSELKDMDESNAVDVRTIDEELWVANKDKVVIKANGRMEMSTMYVKWLPELADDLYYVFLSAVAPKSGWGTFGGNLTFISYGKFIRTGEGSPNPTGEFDSFDFAATVSFGTALNEKVSWGISAKLIYSKLADQGAGAEKGSGTSTGFAVDGGVLYHMTPRLTWGAAITNLGPQMTYIDAAQSDDLPRNLAFGFAYKLLQSDYYRLLVTSEMNKILVGVDDGISQELKEAVFNTGAEFMYSNIFAVRAGYIYDQDGNIKNLTLGAGLSPLENMKFDFSYIPSNSSSVLANTLRLSLTVAP